MPGSTWRGDWHLLGIGCHFVLRDFLIRVFRSGRGTRGCDDGGFVPQQWRMWPVDLGYSNGDWQIEQTADCGLDLGLCRHLNPARGRARHA